MLKYKNASSIGLPENLHAVFAGKWHQIGCEQSAHGGSGVCGKSAELLWNLNDVNRLSHTKWNCKYHIVFAPRYRRKIFYHEKREAVGKILRQLCEWKGVKIVKAEVCPDHVHMLVEIPPKLSVSSFMGYLKGKTSTMLYEQFGELK